MSDEDGPSYDVFPASELAARVKIARAQDTADESKEQADYQNEPKGDEQCSKCSMFVSPSYCTKVIALPDDAISPQGWCKHFDPANQEDSDV